MKAEDTAIDLTDNIKNSALYFKHVIPTHPFFFENDDLFSMLKYIRPLLPNNFVKHSAIHKPVALDFLKQSLVYYMLDLRMKESCGEVEESMLESEAHKVCESAILELSKDTDGTVLYTKEGAYLLLIYFARKVIDKVLASEHLSKDRLYKQYFNKIKVDNALDSVVIYPENADKIFTDSYNCVSVTLSKLNLVDTSKASWEQIIKFREDKKAFKKLRNLKLFFSQNYTGKDMHFIQDDLCKRIDDYRATTKAWGFDTTVSSITQISTSVSAFGATLSAAIYGKPIEESLLTGTLVGIGTACCHIVSEKRKLIKEQEQNPIGYIISAKEKLEG